MIKSFKQFNEQREKEVYFTFGRFNPPTTGHQKLLDKISSVAKGKDYKVYASTSNDPKKNPLEYKEKIRFMRKIFPKHARSIMLNQKVNNALAIASDLHDMGYNKITMVVGGDRVKEFESLLKKYDNVKGRHGYYNFVNGINVVSAGERDPDAKDVTGMSASKMRAAAADGDFKSFQMGLPKGFSGGVELFNTLRKRMGMKEVSDFREHIQLDKISDIREAYARGEIFNIGDKVYNKENKVVVIEERKPNYIVSSIGKKYWITDLSERRVAQDPDVKDKKGTQPKKYYSGLGKSTKSKRDAHFKKGAKMSDDDPNAYKPAPGDATAKTKPSKHTKKFKQMFGESTEALMEKLITFAKKAYPTSGHMVILAGGAGSGKGFVLDNLIGLEGKVFDVDELKRLAMKTPKIIDKVKDEFGTDISKLNLKTPEDVSRLHELIGDEMNLPDKRQRAFFANLIAQAPNSKPNVIFDVTLKDLRKLEKITRTAESIGYEKKNIHIVWVINDIEAAKKQNVQRNRQVPVEILVNTHRGASQTMADILGMGKTLKKYMDGDIVFAFNKINVDSDLEKSKRGGAFLKRAEYFYAKRSGQAVLSKKEIGVTILNKIGAYVPNANTWDIKENIDTSDAMKRYKSGKAGFSDIAHLKAQGLIKRSDGTKRKSEAMDYPSDKLAKKYKKDTPGQEVPEENIKEGPGKKKGETWEQGYERRVVKTTKPEHKEKGYNWRIKGKERDEISIRLYKNKPSYQEFTKQMKRVAGHEFGG